MVAVILAIVGVLIVFAIAAITIGREARRLDSFSPVPVFDVEAAVAYVGDHLPESMSNSVTYWDVRRVLDWELEDLDASGLATESMIVEGPNGPQINRTVVVDDGRLHRLVQRAVDEGTSLSGVEVRAILDAKLGYLRTIGAVGPRADPDELTR